MKVLVFSYKMGEPVLNHFPFRKYGPLTKGDISAMRREKSMKSPRKSDDVITLGDVIKFGLNFSGRSIDNIGHFGPPPNTNLHQKAQY